MWWCYWKMKYQAHTYLTWELNKSLETVCTNCTKQGEEFKAMFRIVFKVFGDHLVWSISYKSQLSLIGTENILTLTIPQECTGKQPQRCEALPQASHLCTYIKRMRLINDSQAKGRCRKMSFKTKDLVGNTSKSNKRITNQNG